MVTRSTEDVAADPVQTVGEHDEERPARRLSGRWEWFVWAASIAVALLVLKQVFLPFATGNQYYLVIFLGLTLPLVFLCYRMLRQRQGRRQPRPVDWALAAIALLVGLYPVLPFGGRRLRAAASTRSWTGRASCPHRTSSRARCCWS